MAGPETGKHIVATAVYRASCCSTECSLERGGRAPACPKCKAPTRWLLVESNEVPRKPVDPPESRTG